MEKEKKIDFVVTWVDGNDEKWLKEKYKYEMKQENYEAEDFQKWINSKIRYRDWENLKYWFRAVEKYAPWVNKIHFITYGHLPKWLDTNNPKLNIVNHKDYIPKEYLPTYNSNVIELNIHRIKELEEYFVLFNDDVFINDYVKPTDFFVNNQPCELAGIDIVKLDYYINNADINNMKILNKYFNKKASIKKNKSKWYQLKYGKRLIKTLLLTPWNTVTGLAQQHVMCSYKKSNFNWLWENEKIKCEQTSKCKFREITNINHWVIKGYQLLSGDFYPRANKFGKSYMKPIDKEIINDIIKHKHKAICINDFNCTEEEFINNKEKLNAAFEQMLPEKSSFEK